MRRTLIAGNWKLNGLKADVDWVRELHGALEGHETEAELVICPPATLLMAFAETASDTLAVGGQDCSVHNDGAHTGEVSAHMLADAGCSYVIVGHSERRADHFESDETVKAKAEAALKAGLTPIVCVGENLEERQAGAAEAIVIAQLLASLPDHEPGSVAVAYEPIWAIGTGLTASPSEAQSMHAALRAALPQSIGSALRLLYGGSVKPDNAGQLLAQPDIDGALVGGASLSAGDFSRIIRAAQ